MGETKLRKAAKDSGRPWAPKMPAPPPGADRAAREMARLTQLSQTAEAATRESLREARAAGDEAARLDRLHDILWGAMSLLEAEVATAYASAPEMQQLQQAVACAKGCSFCCHMAVEATIVEAILVWRRAAHDPALSRAVHDSAAKSANVEPHARWRARTPCPMLGADGACQVYEDRPGSCRAFVSVDAKACERALVSAGTDQENLTVPIVPFPRKIETAISIGVRRAIAAENLQSCNVELTAALHVLATDPTAASRWMAGDTVFTPYP